MADKMHVLTSEELSKIFNAVAALKNRVNSIPDFDRSSRRYLTDTQLAQELHISKRTLANYRAKGEFGYYNLPGKILYSEDEIERFLQRHYLPPFR